MADPQNNRRDEFLKQQQGYRINAFKTICKMLDWCQTKETKLLMDEMLHSIFFLAKICQVPFSPQEIIDNRDMFNLLTKAYPRPVANLSQLPRRTPFSSVMDMVILREKPENDQKIKETLQDIVNTLDDTFPVSSTICISQKSKNSRKHYGISMSTTGPNPRGIMIAASCCAGGPWDDYVAGAVMTFLPKMRKKKDTPEIDGVMKLPEYVICEAFDIKTGEFKKPCKSCGTMFGLPTDSDKEWVYGNCAENESVSNLLKHESEVKKDVKIPSPKGSKEIRARNQKDVGERLQAVLRNTPYKITWNGTFYTA